MIYENGKIYEGFWEKWYSKRKFIYSDKIIKYCNENINIEKKEKIEFGNIKLTDEEFNECLNNNI